MPEERKVPLPGVGDAAANDRKRSYIENQAELSHIPFGTHRKSNMSYSGCEIIAVYNFLLRRGKPADLSKLIQYFELHGASLRGGFGVEPRALYHFLHCRYSSISFSCGKDAEKKLANTPPDACIITVQNDRNDIFQMLHTVCVTKEEAGYVIHNAYRRDKNGRWSASEAYPTVAEAATHITGAPRVVAVVL